MIDKKTYELEYIRTLQKKYSADPALIERALYAFGLLEAIAYVGMPFCFKGGTSLMLILNRPARLSTDIDIIVAPDTDVDYYIEKASRIFPFTAKDESIRKGGNGIVKRHFKFTYTSPLRNNDFYILLDIVYKQNPYSKTVRKELTNELLLTSGSNLEVVMPTADCLLGDKLTAFAPHTTGILLGTGKELEIAKQLFDTATLSEHISDFDRFARTYDDIVQEESSFRNGNWSRDEVLEDTIKACISIISRGKTAKEDYPEYLRGIKGLKNHVLDPSYNTDDAVWKACRVMYLSSCLLSGNTFKTIFNLEEYLSLKLDGCEFKTLAYVRKQNLNSYACLVEATKNLNG